MLCRSPFGPREWEEKLVLAGRELGFPLEDIRTLLELENGEIRCEEVKSIARHQIGQLEERIRDLERLKDSLKDVERRCQGDLVGFCPVIDALRGENGDP